MTRERDENTIAEYYRLAAVEALAMLGFLDILHKHWNVGLVKSQFG